MNGKCFKLSLFTILIFCLIISAGCSESGDGDCHDEDFDFDRNYNSGTSSDVDLYTRCLEKSTNCFGYSSFMALYNCRGFKGEGAPCFFGAYVNFYDCIDVNVDCYNPDTAYQSMDSCYGVLYSSLAQCY